MQGWKASKDSFELWDGTKHESGDECDGKAAEVRWSVNGEEQSGSISGYHPKDGDVIALALLPPDQEIGEPPSASQLAAPSDLSTPDPWVVLTPEGGDTPDTSLTTDTGVTTDTDATTEPTAAPTTTP
jgi:hypothetical protein